MRRIIAIVGLAGSGKTEAVQYLEKKYACPRIYFGAVVFTELEKRGLPVNEANERLVREELRQMHGMAAFAVLSIAKIEAALTQTDLVLIESLYSWEEYVTLAERFGNDFHVMAIQASPATRYARLAQRPQRPLTAAEAQSRDRSQIENLHQAGPIAMADVTIINEQTLSVLHTTLTDAMTALQ